jgi:hypothetical protein
MSEHHDHFPDPEGRAILAALVTETIIRGREDREASTRLYVLEMWAKECGPWGHPAYQVRRKAFWDGAGETETVWFYSAQDAREAWEEYAGYSCPETANDLEILAAERQAA